MKILFLHFFDTTPQSGVNAKISSQISALRELGHRVDLCQIEIGSNGVQRRVCEGEVIETFGKSGWAKLSKWFRFKRVATYFVKGEYQLLYVRSFYNTTPQLLKLYKIVKKSGAKVVIEFPTYPYEKEFAQIAFRNKITLYFDKLYRHSLYKFVDRVVTFSNYSTLFKIPTIRISNGVDFTKIALKSDTTRYQKGWGGPFKLIGVAEIHYWHGFDRIVEGIANYHKSVKDGPKVEFHIVGKGERKSVEDLQQLVAQYKLEQSVFFHGYRQGAQLDALFEIANFGVASLARHRSGITALKTLKTREYAARGIPFIYSEIDDDFEDKPYILKANMDDSPIAIEDLISFWEGLTITPSQIRESVIETLSWLEQMRVVINQLEQRG